MNWYYLTDESEKSLAPFFSKRILDAVMAGVALVAAILTILWPRRPFSEIITAEDEPIIFFLVFSATLIVNSYINLCCGCGEMIRRGYHIIKYRTDLSTFEMENDFLKYGLIEFLSHSLILLLLFLPHLILAASISAVSFILFLMAASILYSASLLCRMFGFMVYLFWGRTSTIGYFLARTFMIVFIFGTFFFAPFLNPLQLLYLLNKSTSGIGLPFVFYMMTVVFAILLLIVANHFLVRRHLRERE